MVENDENRYKRKRTIRNLGKTMWRNPRNVNNIENVKTVNTTLNSLGDKILINV